MRNLHLILILTATLWNVLPANGPFRALFDFVLENPDSGVVTTSDPENDPNMITLPPPR